LTPPQRTALGGGVGIHGGSTPELGSDWTWGCVGLTNKDVEDFYNYVSNGTKVTIQS
jgi:lipoprotein-anchoring transpeptidase ErfK/SrfK